MQLIGTITKIRQIVLILIGDDEGGGLSPLEKAPRQRDIQFFKMPKPEGAAKVIPQGQRDQIGVPVEGIARGCFGAIRKVFIGEPLLVQQIVKGQKISVLAKIGKALGLVLGF